MRRRTIPFVDRLDAGRRLAAALEHLRGEDLVVLGLPRGGVPVAFEVAQALRAPLDVILVRKLGVPFQPELGMGAIGEDGVRIINEEVVRLAHVSPDDLAEVEQRERTELDRRARRFRGDRPRVPLAGRTAIVVDDGIATGSTARAACQVARAQGARRVVLASPVAPPSVVESLHGDADEVVCLETPEWFFAIGQWYANFAQTPDDEVVELLERAALGHSAPGERPEPGVPVSMPGDQEVEVIAGPVRLRGHLTVPERPIGMVIFAHGSGSSSRSPRNQFVAGELNTGGLGTLLFDLLTPEEELDRANVFDIDLLAQRLTEATRWLRQEPGPGDLPIGYFGASTGAAAALWAAGQPGAGVAAVVSRGGRVDLAGPRLSEVRAPTLLIVGEDDPVVLDLNRQAQARLRGENHLAVVPGATHLFEEPGTLEMVANLARDWFAGHLKTAAQLSR
jgi:putative phosphoribosyl transferase